MSSNTVKRCRTCMHSSKDVSEFIELEIIDPVKNLSLKRKLEICVPEIILDNSKVSYLCITCSNALNTAYHFKCTCLATEEKIRTSSKKHNINLNINDFDITGKNISLNEIDRLLDQTFADENSRIQLFQTVDFLLKTQNLAKCYFYPESSTFVEEYVKNACKKDIKKIENEISENQEIQSTQKTATNNTTKKSFECKKCSKVFPNRVKLVNHGKMCQKYFFFCKNCGQGFYFQNMLHKHLVSCKPTKSSINLKTSKSLTQNVESKQETVEEIKKSKGKSLKSPINDNIPKTIKKSVKKNSNSKRSLVIKRPYSKSSNKNKTSQTSNFKLQVKKTAFKKNANTPNKCPLCPSILSSNYKYQLHLKRHSKKRDFLCSLCPKRFYENWELKRHKKIRHSEEMQDQKVNSNNSTEASVISGHEENTDQVFYNLIWDDNILNKNPTLVTQAIHKVIGTSFEEKKTSDNPNISLSCNTSNFEFASVENMNLQIEHKNNFRCEKCNVDFFTVELFNMHMKNHTDIQDFSTVFVKSENDVSQTSERKSVNVEKKSIKKKSKKKFEMYCNVCKCNVYNTDHFNTHSGARPYTCGVCKMTFRHKPNAIRHMLRIHKKVEVIEDKRFQEKKACKDCHEVIPLQMFRAHNCQSIYTCEICKEKFTGKPGFVEHMVVHVQQNLDMVT